MKNFNKIAIAIAALSCGAGANALAQQSNLIYPSWYLAPSINVMDVDSGLHTDKTGAGIGMRFGGALSPMWDVQFGPTASTTDMSGSHYAQGLVGIDGLYMFSRDRLRPFVLMGGGFEYDRVVPTGGGSRARSSPYLNAGVGLQYDLTDRLALQADVRHVHGFLHSGNQFGMSSIKNNYLTVGLNYSLGKNYEKPAAPVARAEPAPEPVKPVEEPKAAPVPVPPAPVPAPAPRIERYSLSATELFGFNSATLSKPQPKLDEIATALNNGDAKVNNVVITGYSDRLGSKKYNVKLSKQRAEAVKAYLADKGVSSSRLTTEGKGEANPVVQCKKGKRAALIKCLEPNRRVEIEQITIEHRVQ